MGDVREMTKDERSLLLYLETCATDYGGTVDQRHMNDEDREILERWTREGFMQSGRICFHDAETLSRHTRKVSHWVVLSDVAWTAAHAERRARYERLEAKRTWMRTEEKNATGTDGGPHD
jgi:hypothetical protein